MARYVGAHSDRLASVLLVVGSAVADVRRYAADRERVPFAVVVADPRGEAADALGVEGTPTYLLFQPGRTVPIARAHRVTELPRTLPARAPASRPDAAPEPPSDGDGGQAGGAADRTDRESTSSPGARLLGDDSRELGTSYTVLIETTDLQRGAATLRAARELVREWEARLSEWREDSEISRINREAPRGAVPISREVYDLLHGALRLAEQTGGAFDPTWRTYDVGWAEAERTQVWPDEATLASWRSAAGWRQVQLTAPAPGTPATVAFRHAATRIGVAAFAKGWIVERVYAFLRGQGYEVVLVNIGGDLRLSEQGPQGAPWVVPIQSPFGGAQADTSPQHTGRDAGDQGPTHQEPTHRGPTQDSRSGPAVSLARSGPGQIVAYLDVEGLAVATSGNYRRGRTIAGRWVGHVLDPRSGLPPSFDGSVTVLAPESAIADALATALFVMGPDEGLRFARAVSGVEAVFVTREGIRSTLPIRAE